MPFAPHKELQELTSGRPVDFALAHCVAQDFQRGSGIAGKFKEEFKGVGELLDQNVTVGGCAHLQRNNRYIFYLVTKEVSNGKPTYDTLRASLRTMKLKCLKLGVKKLAIPRIGCGLDKLDWSRVRSSIIEIFQDTGIEIHVYEFNVERLPDILQEIKNIQKIREQIPEIIRKAQETQKKPFDSTKHNLELEIEDKV